MGWGSPWKSWSRRKGSICRRQAAQRRAGPCTHSYGSARPRERRLGRKARRLLVRRGGGERRNQGRRGEWGEAQGVGSQAQPLAPAPPRWCAEARYVQAQQQIRVWLQSHSADTQMPSEHGLQTPCFTRSIAFPALRPAGPAPRGARGTGKALLSAPGPRADRRQTEQRQAALSVHLQIPAPALPCGPTAGEGCSRRPPFKTALGGWPGPARR